jgi:hypothetical protein
MRHRARLVSICIALAGCAHAHDAVTKDKSSAGVERRHIATPGEGPPLWPNCCKPRASLHSKRLPFSPKEAAELEGRLFAWLASSSDPYTSELRGEWASYVLLFDKVGSSTGDKVVVQGLDQMLLNPYDPDHPPSHVTVESLRAAFGGLDGGCMEWSLVYDVRTKRFYDLGCNGQA